MTILYCKVEYEFNNEETIGMVKPRTSVPPIIIKTDVTEGFTV